MTTGRKPYLGMARRSRLPVPPTGPATINPGQAAVPATGVTGLTDAAPAAGTAA
ncbi:hypothetical protein PICSAR132_04549 [Mycobacterium avium subsp. paratuberculosis]|nr:hypothetical protein PICSAR132_04549 [Mycobacterium avium subsp. paratuberculosis]